jgi:hypothetical protein
MMDIDLDIEIGNLKHFKLVGGEEIICEILEDLEDDLIVRHALRIVKMEVAMDRTYYMFKNWMVFQEKSGDTIALNKFQIVGIANPSFPILKEYLNAVKIIILEKNKEEDEEDNSNPIDAFLRKMLAMNNDEGDSGQPSNVISFRDRSRLH